MQPCHLNFCDTHTAFVGTEIVISLDIVLANIKWSLGSDHLFSIVMPFTVVDCLLRDGPRALTVYPCALIWPMYTVEAEEQLFLTVIAFTRYKRCNTDVNVLLD